VARQLVVIVGAGASADCVTYGGVRNDRRRPPLVRTLFHDYYQDVLDKYPLAGDVAAEVRARLVQPAPGEEALKLEDFLREELRDSEAAHRRAQYWAVPLYLQELLLQCSWQFTNLPDNFNRLVTSLLHLERVTFVTLNYDTILDRVLDNHFPLPTEEHYFQNPKFALIKLHGSVNWGRRFLSEQSEDLTTDRFTNLCRKLADNSERLSDEVTVIARPSEPYSADQLRSNVKGGFFYPAVSAPLGPDDEPTCPPSHIEALKSALSEEAYGVGLHVLVVGYSCLDKTPLDYIRDSGNPIVSLWIANGTEEASRDAYERMLKHMPSVVPSPTLRSETDTLDLINGGFTFIATPQFLSNLVEHVRNWEPPAAD